MSKLKKSFNVPVAEEEIGEKIPVFREFIYLQESGNK